MSEHDTCLVTGCAGFIGSHLAERLLNMGHSVVGVDNFSTGKPENMDTFQDSSRFQFHKVDITTPYLLRRLKKLHPELNRIFHLAAIVSVPYSVENPGITMETNFIASITIFAEAMEMGFISYVFAGSAAEYGNLQQLPIKEEAVKVKEEHSGLANLQESPYGMSKFLVSRYIENLHFGASLRFFNIYGPRQDPSSQYSGVISRFVDQALRNDPLTVLGDGEQSRDFVHVQDVVDAYLLAAGMLKGNRDTQAPLSGVYNVGSQIQLSINDLADKIIEIADSTAGKVHLPPRAGDIRHSLADISKFKNATGYSPKIPLQEGLSQLIDWCRNEQEALESRT